MKVEAKNFNLTAAIVNFLSWLLFVFDGFYLGEDLNHGAFLNDLSLLGYGLLIGFIVILVLKLIGIKRIRQVLFYISLGCWFLFLILQTGPFTPYLIPWLTAYNIRIGLFVANNFLFVWVFGVVNCSILALTLQRRLEEAAKTRKSIALELMFAFASIALISLGHVDYRTYGLEVIFAVAAVIFLIFHREEPDPESQMFQLRPKRNIIIGFLSFISVTAMFYGSYTLTLAEFNYYTVHIAFPLFFGAATITVVFGNYANNSTRGKFPFYVYLILAAVISFGTILLLTVIIPISDSTYETNSPLYFPSLLGGLIFGLLALSVDKAYIQFKYSKKGYSEFQRNVFDARRYFIPFGFSFMMFFGAIEGFDLKTFSDSLTEVFIIGFWVIVGIAGIIAIIYLITYFTDKMPIANDEPEGYYEDEDLHDEAHDRTSGSEARSLIVDASLLKPVLLMVVILLSGLAIFPNLGHANVFEDEQVNLLGNQDDVVIAEVSPLIKVDPNRLVPRPLGQAADLSSPMIKRCMARNEYESIQITLSNWRLRGLEVESVNIKNSTYGNYDSAFSGDPLEKSWKGEAWNWSRFTAQYVSEIHEGYPHVLYELNGDQTAIVKVRGENKPRPEPKVSIGQTLSLWFTVYAGEDLAPGNYSDEITIHTNKWDFSVTLLTNVWDFTLPTNHSLRTGIGNRRVYYLENRDLWTKNFLKHRMSPYFPHNRRNFYEVDDEVVTFDFTQFEEDLDNAIAHGLDSFRITFKPDDIDGPDAFTESWNNTALSYYQQLATFLKSHSLGDGRTWLDLALVYAMDEPSEDEYDIFKNWSNLVHSADPDWNVLLTEQVEDPLKGTVDIWCPHINSVNTANIGTEQAAGNEFWYYTCCNLVNKPTVSFVDPAVDHKALFWCAFAFDFEGFLFWDAAAYVDQDVNDPYYVGYDNKGDAIMLLNDADLNPVTTIVWETMRDGLEDFEYFELLKEKDPTNEYLDAIINVWDDFASYPRDFRDYTAIRRNIGILLSDL